MAKYDRPGPVRLRDVLFLCHAKPDGPEKEVLWKQLVDGTLPAPDTWEASLSAGADKGETFTRLLRGNKLGYLALLRNLRNMVQVGVDPELMRAAILRGAAKSMVLPFRFVAAAKAAPSLRPVLDEAMKAVLIQSERLTGRTHVLIDVSGSMDARLSAKSDLSRLEAAAALAVLVCGLSSQVRVFTFSNTVVEVAPSASLSLLEKIGKSQPHGGTELGKAVKTVEALGTYDRLIVITDEQSHDRVPAPSGSGYMINVAAYANGVGYGPWLHIDGFSESVIDFISANRSAGRTGSAVER